MEAHPAPPDGQGGPVRGDRLSATSGRPTCAPVGPPAPPGRPGALALPAASPLPQGRLPCSPAPVLAGRSGCSPASPPCSPALPCPCSTHPSPPLPHRLGQPCARRPPTSATTASACAAATRGSCATPSTPGRAAATARTSPAGCPSRATSTATGTAPSGCSPPAPSGCATGSAVPLPLASSLRGPGSTDGGSTGGLADALLREGVPLPAELRRTAEHLRAAQD